MLSEGNHCTLIGKCVNINKFKIFLHFKGCIIHFVFLFVQIHFVYFVSKIECTELLNLRTQFLHIKNHGDTCYIGQGGSKDPTILRSWNWIGKDVAETWPSTLLCWPRASPITYYFVGMGPLPHAVLFPHEATANNKSHGLCRKPGKSDSMQCFTHTEIFYWIIFFHLFQYPPKFPLHPIEIYQDFMSPLIWKVNHHLSYLIKE